MPDTVEDGIAAALGRIPSGLFILTVRQGDRETGMLASWVQQCSFAPPRLTAAIRKGRPLLDWLTDQAAFVVNVIPEDGRPLTAHFGKGFEPGEPAFTGLEMRREGDGPPILLAAHAYLTCRVCDRLDVGDHVLVVGTIEAGGLLRPGQPAVHVRKNGLRY